jgi:uncharacterized membrane protein YfcA
MPVEFWQLGAAWSITLAAAALHGTIGFGFALVNVPLLALIDSSLAPVPQLLLILPLNAAVVWRERYAVDLRGVGWVMAGRLPGAAAGLALLATVDEDRLATAIAVIILLAIVIVSSGVTVPRNRTTSFVAGTASGVMGLVAAIGGPPLALLYRSERGATIRASLGTVFGLGVIISIAARALASQISMNDIGIAALLLPAVAAGLWVGRRWRDRIEGSTMRAAILLVSGAAAAVLLVQSLV